MVRRSLSPKGLAVDDFRHPLYFHLNAIWLRKAEIPLLVPKPLEVGATRPLPEALARRLLVASTLTPEFVDWGGTDALQSGPLRLRITDLSEAAVTVRLEGAVELKTRSAWADGHYRGRVVGELAVSRDLETLEALELVAAGRLRNKQDRPRDETSLPGSLITLAPPDRETPRFPEGYDGPGYFR